MPSKPEKPDIADAAEAEALAQLNIIRALKRLPTQEDRARVLNAVAHICEADRLVPGVLASIKRSVVENLLSTRE